MAAALLDLAAEHDGATAAVVGHGLALRMATLQLLGWDLPVGLGLSGLWNGSWTVLERRDRWRILSYNNVAPDAG